MPRFVRYRKLHRGQIWTVTSLYVAMAVLLATAGIHLGERANIGMSAMSSASAITMLSAIAAGMITLTSIVFSVYALAFSSGSSLYSPRLMSLVERQRWLPHTFGVFAGTFIYALLAIPAVERGSKAGVNWMIVTAAMGWLALSVYALLVIIGRFRRFSLAQVLSRLSTEGAGAVSRLYDRPSKARSAVDAGGHGEMRIRHDAGPGYFVGLDMAALVNLARRARGTIRIPMTIGDVAVVGDPIAVVRGDVADLDDDAIRRAIWLGHDRFIPNDPAYAIRLIVDIAIRALSPAVNDPSTATNAVDHLEYLLRLLGRSNLDIGRIADEDGVIRVVFDTPCWDDLVTEALVEIRQYGASSPQVMRRYRALIDDLDALLPDDRLAAIHQVADADLQSPADRQGLGHSRAMHPPH